MLYFVSTLQGTYHRDAKLDMLLGRMAQHDTGALEAFYKDTKGAVFAYALSILKNPYEAEDVMQETYLSIYSAAGKYHSTGKPMAWVITITKNHCLQRIREQSRFDPRPWEELDLYLENKETLSVENKEVISYCLKQLKEEEQQILLLHTISGMKHREIAALMGLALPTVLSKYNRALKKLKEKLRDDSVK
ncbi:MAG: RNA polymerase sigma factor [Lachnospiraceae bacterium]|nr:RNA polymerase sigma factor [Lachnospiraceae bacterium]